MLAVAERWWARLRVRASPMELGGLPSGYTPVRVLESHEANVAGRIGLCAAVRQHLDADPAAVRKRLAEVGRMTREILGDTTGWAVVDPVDAPAAISALRPLAGQDVAGTRARLIAEHGIVTTAAQPARAPREMTEPLLRVSPQVDCTPEELSLLADALSAA
jgi:pyridoxal 5-phosphate dependent beta-lyase